MNVHISVRWTRKRILLGLALFAAIAALVYPPTLMDVGRAVTAAALLTGDYTDCEVSV